MFVYLIKEENTEKYKLGVSMNPERRVKQLQTASSERLELRKKFKTNYNYMLEKYLHRVFRKYKVIGEWYKLSEEEEQKFQEVCEQGERTFSLLDKENTYINRAKFYE